MTKRATQIVILLLSFCLTVSACTNSNVPVPFEKWEKNEFFGLNLDNNDQVGEFHKLLISGKLDWNGTKLEEWDDGWGSDYDLSEGKISTTCIFNGTAQDTRLLFNQLDSAFFKRYNNREPLKQKEWAEINDGMYSISYLNFFNYKGYRIGLTMVIVSSEKDEKTADAGCVRIGLGAISLPDIQ